MTRQRPRPEFLVALGLVAFIALAFVKPWGSDPRSADARATATTSASPPSPTLHPTPDAVADVSVGTLAGSIALPYPPTEPIEFEGDLWLGADAGHVLRIDPTTTDLTDIVLDQARFSEKVGLARLGDGLWVIGADDRSVGLFDTTTLDLTERIPAESSTLMVIDKVNGAVSEGGRLWFFADVHASQEILGTPCCYGFTDTLLYRVDQSSSTMTQVRQLKRPKAIGVGFGSVWVLRQPDGSDKPAVIDRLDQRTGTLIATVGLPAIGTGFSPCGACITWFLVGSNSLWVPTGLGKSLLRIDPEAGRVVATIDLGRYAGPVEEAPDGYIWVAGGVPPVGGCEPSDGFVVKIDPSTNRIRGGVSVACPVSLAAVAGDIWVGTDGPKGPSIQRIRPTQ